MLILFEFRNLLPDSIDDMKEDYLDNLDEDGLSNVQSWPWAMDHFHWFVLAVTIPFLIFKLAILAFVFSKFNFDQFLTIDNFFFSTILWQSMCRIVYDVVLTHRCLTYKKETK